MFSEKMFAQDFCFNLFVEKFKTLRDIYSQTHPKGFVEEARLLNFENHKENDQFMLLRILYS